MEDARRTRSSESTEQNSYALTETEVANRAGVGLHQLLYIYIIVFTFAFF